MTLWHALVVESGEDWVLPLFGGYLFTALFSRIFEPRDRSRMGSIAFLVVLQWALVFAAAGLRTTGSDALVHVRLVSLIIGALAAIGMLASITASVTARTRFPIPTIVRDVIAAALGLIAIFTIAARMGIDLTSVLATSAIVTAVIGFSLQDTLGNIIGGMALELDSSIQIGDWIKVGDIAGIVREIRWRYTAVETRNWETVIIPNGVLTKSQVTVLGRRAGKPLQWRRWVWFNVDFRSSPTDVISAVNDALRDCHIDNVATEPSPSCILMDLHDSYGRYAVRYWLTNLLLDDPTDSVIRTRIYLALKRVGISPSIPAVAAFVTEESAERKIEKDQARHERLAKALAGIEIFNTLPEDVRRRLADSLRPAPFAAGEIMTRQGAEAHWLYLVVHGEVSVRVSTNGGPPKETRRLRDGSIFGEMSLLTGEPRTATLVALTNVDCLRLDRPIAHEILTQRPEFAERIAELLAQKHYDEQHPKADLDQEARDRQIRASKVDLLERIRQFFGLDEEAESEKSAEAG
jgi:small-conductance mechanosensitive channel/CRP-like cAMP-binding protein